MKNWRRYRFKTNSIDDYRPLIFNPEYPWWCSGQNGTSATIIAYLPPTENLKKYWDDAYDTDFTEHDTIEFTSRFPKPAYFNPAPVTGERRKEK